jgi:AraC-like DNA-binding protein
MASDDWADDAAAVWDIATPACPGRVPGLTMAGFRQRTSTAIDLSVIPYPAVTVAVDLGEGLAVVSDVGGHEARGCAVFGLALGPVRATGRNIECLQMRLSPLVAPAVLGAALDLRGATVTLEDLWGNDASRTHEQLRDAASWNDRFAIAEAALARRLGARTVDVEVGHVWQQMARHKGQVRVEDLAGEIGWSRKRLWSRFRSQIGITPKRAAQLVRFDHAAHHLAAGDGPAAVAAEHGYTDQSHLHRDAIAFAGLTPAAVAAAPWLAVDGIAWPAPDYVSAA